MPSQAFSETKDLFEVLSFDKLDNMFLIIELALLLNIILSCEHTNA